MCAWCWHTRGRFESTHGGVLDGHTGVFSVPHHTRHTTTTTTHNDTQHTTNQPTNQHKTKLSFFSFLCLSFFSVCSVRSVFSLLVFVFYLVSILCSPLFPMMCLVFFWCLCLFSLCFHGFSMDIKNVTCVDVDVYGDVLYVYVSCFTI